MTLAQFRNHESLRLDLPPGAVVLTGGNGSGKTSVLEAVHWAATGRSHRVASSAPLVRVGQPEARLRVDLEVQDRSVRLDHVLRPGGRSTGAVNSGTPTSTSSALGLLRVVVFSPDDVALVRGEPAGRRAYLDDVLVQLSPRVSGLPGEVDRVLRQRTALLRAAGGRLDAEEAATLDVFDARLVTSGASLALYRARLLADLLPLVRRACQAVAGSDDVRLETQSAWQGEAQETTSPAEQEQVLSERLASALQERRQEEVRRGTSLVGPHRDDVAVVAAGMPARTHASAGETWTLALALRLGAAALLRAQGEDPVLLLDDVLGELDAQRRAALAVVCAGFEQVLLTTAVPGDVPADLRDAVLALA